MATKNIINTSYPIEVVAGGTGTNTLLDHGVLVGSGTSPVDALAVGATGTVLVGNTGGDPAFTDSPSVAGSVTAATGVSVTTGNVDIVAGNLNLPTTTATAGAVNINAIRFAHAYGTDNTFFGSAAGNFTLNVGLAVKNTALGVQALQSIVDGIDNTAFGVNALFSNQNGDGNTAIGVGALQTLTNGNNNVAIGRVAGVEGALPALAVGNYNIAIGAGSTTDAAGGAYTTSESSNILLSNSGVVGESNVIRIGTQGTGDAQQNACYIAGIASVTVSNAVTVVIDTTTGKLGTAPGAVSTWTDVTGTSANMVANNGYTPNNVGLVTLTLPVTAAYGSVIQVTGKGSGGWLIAQNAGQTIHVGPIDTTTGVGGSLASTVRYDSVTLRCTTADTDWVVEAMMGNITVV